MHNLHSIIIYIYIYIMHKMDTRRTIAISTTLYYYVYYQSMHTLVRVVFCILLEQYRDRSEQNVHVQPEMFKTSIFIPLHHRKALFKGKSLVVGSLRRVRNVNEKLCPGSGNFLSNILLKFLRRRQFLAVFSKRGGYRRHTFTFCSDLFMHSCVPACMWI